MAESAQHPWSVVGNLCGLQDSQGMLVYLEECFSNVQHQILYHCQDTAASWRASTAIFADFDGPHRCDMMRLAHLPPLDGNVIKAPLLVLITCTDTLCHMG